MYLWLERQLASQAFQTYTADRSDIKQSKKSNIRDDRTRA